MTCDKCGAEIGQGFVHYEHGRVCIPCFDRLHDEAAARRRLDGVADLALLRAIRTEALKRIPAAERTEAERVEALPGQVLEWFFGCDEFFNGPEGTAIYRLCSGGTLYSADHRTRRDLSRLEAAELIAADMAEREASNAPGGA
jgi:hypothetical protein